MKSTRSATAISELQASERGLLAWTTSARLLLWPAAVEPGEKKRSTRNLPESEAREVVFSVGKWLVLLCFASVFVGVCAYV